MSDLNSRGDIVRFVIISGMSGAGKSTALNVLEDMGFYCVDNLPVAMLPDFAKAASAREPEAECTAVTADIRSGGQLKDLSRQLEYFSELGISYEILFLDADDRTLVKRYKETRRKHPLAKEDRVENGLSQERKMISFIKERADYIIDTSSLLTRELKQELEKIFVRGEKYGNFIITILSFGFKYGIPSDADLVFDVRFLPNPYYDTKLRPMTGDDLPVQQYVMKGRNAELFLDKLCDMLTFLIPQYLDEGKYRLVIGIGCTGGKHRSVTIANALYQQMQEQPYSVRLEHRDMRKDLMVSERRINNQEGETTKRK